MIRRNRLSRVRDPTLIIRTPVRLPTLTILSLGRITRMAPITLTGRITRITLNLGRVLTIPIPVPIRDRGLVLNRARGRRPIRVLIR